MSFCFYTIPIVLGTNFIFCVWICEANCVCVCIYYDIEDVHIYISKTGSKHGFLMYCDEVSLSQQFHDFFSFYPLLRFHFLILENKIWWSMMKQLSYCFKYLRKVFKLDQMKKSLIFIVYQCRMKIWFTNYK